MTSLTLSAAEFCQLKSGYRITKSGAEEDASVASPYDFDLEGPPDSYNETLSEASAECPDSNIFRLMDPEVDYTESPLYAPSVSGRPRFNEIRSWLDNKDRARGPAVEDDRADLLDALLVACHHIVEFQYREAEILIKESRGWVEFFDGSTVKTIFWYPSRGPSVVPWVRYPAANLEKSCARMLVKNLHSARDEVIWTETQLMYLGNVLYVAREAKETLVFNVEPRKCSKHITRTLSEQSKVAFSNPLSLTLSEGTEHSRIDEMKRWISEDGAPVKECSEEDNLHDLALLLKLASDHITTVIDRDAGFLVAEANNPDCALLHFVNGKTVEKVFFDIKGSQRELRWSIITHDVVYNMRQRKAKWQIVRYLEAAKREISWMNFQMQNLRNEIDLAKERQVAHSNIVTEFSAAGCPRTRRTGEHFWVKNAEKSRPGELQAVQLAFRLGQGRSVPH